MIALLLLKIISEFYSVLGRLVFRSLEMPETVAARSGSSGYTYVLRFKEITTGAVTCKMKQPCDHDVDRPRPRLKQNSGRS